jgi:hypothetical protein
MCKIHALASLSGEVSRVLVRAIAHNRYGSDARAAPVAFPPAHAALIASGPSAAGPASHRWLRLAPLSSAPPQRDTRRHEDDL